jgi:hypothetical protein
MDKNAMILTFPSEPSNMQHIIKLFILLSLIPVLSGCFFTKLVTVPMRVGGAVVSIIPVVGNTADAAIDATADTLDELPF